MPFTKSTSTLSPGFTSSQLCNAISILFQAAGFTEVRRTSEFGRVQGYPAANANIELVDLFRQVEAGAYGGVAIRFRCYADATNFYVIADSGIEFQGTRIVQPIMGDAAILVTTAPLGGMGWGGTPFNNTTRYDLTIRYHNASPMRYVGLNIVDVGRPGRMSDGSFFWAAVTTQSSWFTDVGGVNTFSPWFFFRPTGSLTSGALNTAGHLLLRSSPNVETSLYSLHNLGAGGIATGALQDVNAYYGIATAGNLGHVGNRHIPMLDGRVELRNPLGAMFIPGPDYRFPSGPSTAWQWGAYMGTFHSDVAAAPSLGPAGIRLVVTPSTEEYESIQGRTGTVMSPGIANGQTIYLRAV